MKRKLYDEFYLPNAPNASDDSHEFNFYLINAVEEYYDRVPDDDAAKDLSDWLKEYQPKADEYLKDSETYIANSIKTRMSMMLNLQEIWTNMKEERDSIDQGSADSDGENSGGSADSKSSGA